MSAESKVCVRCGSLFFKRAKVGRARWELRRFCSDRCAKTRTLDELVDRSGPHGCWLWRGSVHHTGYGYITIGGRMVQAQARLQPVKD